MLFKRKYVKSMLVGAMFTLLGTATVYAANEGLTTGDQIRLRNGASTESEVLTTLPADQAVEVLSLEGDWYKVKQPNGSDAFLAKEFVKLTKTDAVVSDDAVNIRAVPDAAGAILETVNAGRMITVTGVSGDFYSVDYNGTQAFIHKDYLFGAFLPSVTQQSVGQPVGEQQTTQQSAPQPAEPAAPTAPQPAAPTAPQPAEPTAPQPAEPTAEMTAFALITSDSGLNLRAEPSEEAPVLLTLQPGVALDLLEKEGAWNKVAYNGTEGYVSADFVSTHTGVKPENSKGVQIIEYAKQFLGTPYVWAGTNLNGGVDCSGFTYAVMRDNGIAVNRSSRDQFLNGSDVAKDALAAGDLVFFDTTNATNQGFISHVGIYMGGGQFIHSSSSSKSYCVTISSLSEDYYVMRYVGARRVIG